MKLLQHSQYNILKDNKKKLYIYIYIYIYTQWNISHKNEWNLAMCENMNGSREYYAK